MNSFRIGAIGVLVEYGGPEQAEGFLHDFEGWIIFMACVALLVFEMWLLTKIGNDNRQFSEIFGMEFPVPADEDQPVSPRAITSHTIFGIFILMVAMASAFIVGGRDEFVPDRENFVSFPSSVAGWTGQNDALESIVLDTLKLDDYLLADYRNTDGRAINLYIAYYGSQRSGASAHSPRSCLPGGGWRIESHEAILLESNQLANRFVISKGDNRQVVYYWFKQRDRIITSEIAVKWYLLWDALTRNRTDGALVRLTAFLLPGEDSADADRRLQSFINDIDVYLVDYLPD